MLILTVTFPGERHSQHAVRELLVYLIHAPHGLALACVQRLGIGSSPFCEIRCQPLAHPAF